MASTGLLPLRVALFSVVAALVPLATFDGATGSTWSWQPVNDPVMGGASESAFSVDTDRKLGVWAGEVKIVPFLKAPGFCNLQAPGLGKTAAFPDVSHTDGLVVRSKQTNSSGLKRFRAMITTKDAKHFRFQQGVYVADFEMKSEMADHSLSWSAFVCTWRGSNVSWCPTIESQLSKITNIGIGTTYPGPTGSFNVEIESIFAPRAPLVRAFNLVDDGATIDLATFDGTTSHTWKTENDPVMGGKSDSSFAVKNGYGDYSGNCRIVPALKAPGFTFALTEMPLFARFPDVSSADGIILGVRNLDGNVTKFRFAFCDSHINVFRCQFQSFKATFTLAPSDDFNDVFLPWSAFSDKWSSSTGEHTAEEPPQASSLRSITQLQLWTEGVEGHFHVQLKYVKAGKASQQTSILV
jgi:hypothetical protein